MIKMHVLFLILALFNVVYAADNPAKCHCGIPHYQNYPARIYKGNEPVPHSHPWVVLIKTIGGKFGGVLLSTHHVLTAASEIG